MRVLAILLVTATLGGCVGSSDTSQEPCTLEPALCDPDHYLANHHCITNDVKPRIYAPDTPGPEQDADPWTQGDWWTFDIRDGADATTTTLVYYDDADFNRDGIAQHYMVGTPDENHALTHALYSINPVLGRIHRTLYSPHEQGLHADMFYFPLCNGSTWRTGFYGSSFDLTAERADVRLPGGTTDPLAFVIRGTAPDGARLEHTYSPQVKWFTHIQLERADGTTLRIDLKAFGTGRTGEMHFLRAQKDVVVDLAGIQEKTVTRTAGSEGAYDVLGVALDVTRTGTGRVEVHLRDPSGTSRACVGFSGSGLQGQTQCPAPPLLMTVPFSEGEWRITVEKPATDIANPTSVTGEARVVSIYDRGGTV